MHKTVLALGLPGKKDKPMKKSKAFWLTFLAALALLIPLYAIIYLQAMLQNHTDSPAAASQSQVGVDKPSPEDWRNLFVCATGD